MEEKREALVTYSFGGRLRTVRLAGNVFHKLRFAPEDHLEALRSAASRISGKSREYNPSTYGSVFHDPYPPARMLTYSSSLHAPDRVVGAWEEARKTGVGGVNLKELDIVSAYAWAGLRALPSHRSMWPVYKWSGKGIYFCRVNRTGGVVPPPHLRIDFRRPDQLVWLTSEEIDELDLKVTVLRGMTFSKWWEPKRRIEKLISLLPEPVWKKVLRAYWGAWASSQPVVCHSKNTGNTWSARNFLYDPIAAHYIVSRVRNRIAQEAGHAYHIYVDSIITDKSIPTGTAIGDWHCKNRFEKLYIHGAGRWVDIGTGQRKQSGERRVETA